MNLSARTTGAWGFAAIPKQAGLAKEAFLNVGRSVGHSGRHHFEIGFPHILGYSYDLGDPKKKGWTPAFGVGLGGPKIGPMYKPGNDQRAKLPKKTQNEESTNKSASLGLNLEALRRKHAPRGVMGLG